MAGKTRVAILGGGVAALTAAYALSEVDPTGEQYEITLYQLGWRLGGKTASGRNQAFGERIEEHGLHIWAGFYENAFTVLRSALLALNRPPGSPQATIEQTFVRQDQVFLCEDYENQWLPWPMWFQPDADPTLYPGRDSIFDPPDSVIPPLETLINRGVEAFLYGWQYYADQWPGDPQADTQRKVAAMSPAAKAAIARVEAAAASVGAGHPLLAIAAALAAAVTPGRRSAEDPAQIALTEVAKAFLDLVGEALAGNSGVSTEVRRYWIGLCFGLRILAGCLINDCLLHGLCVLDQYDFIQFLSLLAPIGESQAMAAALYDYAFAYLEGEQPLLSACTAVQGVIRMFMTYKGGFFFKATAGMGDTICTPIYEVLRQRGVSFKFFHQVTALTPTPDGFNVGAISINRQVALAPGVPDYDPLRMVGGLPCWPSEPRWEQLLDGEKLRAQGVDFEDVLDPLPPPAEQLTLTLGQDFDQVVLGISVGSLAQLCAPLTAVNIAWADMVANLPTTRTQAFQVWLDAQVTTLGGPFVAPQIPPDAWWPFLPPPPLPGAAAAKTAMAAGSTSSTPTPPIPPWSQAMGPILTGYLKPFDTYSDMSQLLTAEAWPTPGPQSIGYFCSVLPDSAAPNNQAQADAVVKQNALTWMQSDLPVVWTNIVVDGQFQWQLMHADASLQGPARFDQQFWQANINPSERYVLSLPGTLTHRLEPGNSGFDNLFLAGDWTKVPDINAGCVEVAAMSGLMAASALSGVEIPIVSSDTLYRAPQFANYGGWTQLPPPPSLSKGASIYGWALPASKAAMQRFLDRSLNAVAGRRRFKPLLDLAFLTIVKSPQLSAATPPFSLEGTMPETDVGLWIPVAAWDPGHLLPSIGWFPAYLFVDNPYPTASGREIWGFPKFVAQTAVPDGQPWSAGPFEVQANVITTFGPNSVPAMTQQLSITGSNIQFTGFDGGALDIFKAIAHGADPALMAAAEAAHAAGGAFLPGLNLPAPIFFLKQFHAADSATEACYQAILKGALTTTAIEGAGLLTGDWLLSFSQSDSLPFIRDLGLGTPQFGLVTLNSKLAFWAEADFTVSPAKPFPDPA